MKLSTVNFYLDWPKSIEVCNLRQFIIKNLLKKGRVIRWSIINIQDSADTFNTKKLRINAVLLISTNSQL